MVHRAQICDKKKQLRVPKLAGGGGQGGWEFFPSLTVFFLKASLREGGKNTLMDGGSNGGGAAFYKKGVDFFCGATNDIALFS